MYEILNEAAGLISEGWLVIILAHVFVLEVPRFLVSAFAIQFHKEKEIPADLELPPFSVVIAGHNEGDCILECIEALKEQIVQPDEIIVVSDGSNDDMNEKLFELLQQGRITAYHKMDLRGGKSPSLNLAFHSCSHEYIVNIDCDTNLSRFAMRNILARLIMQDASAASGNVIVYERNPSLITSCQALEYFFRIEIGKRALSMVDQVSLISGAFGAFRKSALLRVGGMDSVSGEDLDISLRLRRADEKIIYAHDAVCYTKVPDHFSALCKQRFRWDRDALRLRMSRHFAMYNPFHPQFCARELIHYVDFLMFDLLPAMLSPLVILYLATAYGGEIFGLSLMYFSVYLMIDLMLYVMAASIYPIDSRKLIILPIYTIYNTVVIRLLRLMAYICEMSLQFLITDDFVPSKVQRANQKI